MKRLISMVLSVIIAISLLPLGTLTVSASTFAGGDGSLENPYQISTAEQLNAVRNDLDACYILVKDIDLSKYNEWIPIGNNEKCFTGHFDGKNRIISNMKITSPSYEAVGLFGVSDKNSIIKNIKLSDVDININKTMKEREEFYVGSILGNYITLKYPISNCHATGQITVMVTNHNDGQPIIKIGGIVGQGATEKSSNKTNIKANTSSDSICHFAVGGVIGSARALSDIQKNINYGNIEVVAGEMLRCGGIVAGGGGIEYCVNYGNINCTVTNSDGGDDCQVGGIVGSNDNYIKNSVNLGEVKSSIHTIDDISKFAYATTSYVGGIVGTGNHSGLHVDNCINASKKISAYRPKSNTDASSIYEEYTGRISGGGINISSINNDCFSINTTIINGKTASNDDIYPAHGQSKDESFINNEINKILGIIKGLSIEGKDSIQNNKETILKAVRYDENGNVAPEGGITWSCSDESVAQIIPWGNNVTVKGLKGGKTTITATHAESGQKADFEIEVVSYVMTLAGGYTVMLDEELEINYAVKQGEEYVHNDLDIKWEIESKDSNNAVKIISDKDNAYTRALTIKGINEGECELVAKVDGAELGRTKIEVLGNLAETIEQEVVLRAKILKANSQYKYYKNNFTDLPEMFTKDMNKTPAVLYNAINDVFKAPTDRTNFYEIVLLDILTDGESTKLLGELGNIVDNKIVQHATKQIGNLDFDTNTSSADTTVKKMFDELLDEADDVGKVKVGDVLDGLYTGKKMVDTYIDTVASTYSLGLVSNSQIKVLEDIKNNTTNSNLKEACDNVLDMYYKSSKDGVSYAAQLGMVESGYDGLEFATGQLIDTVCKLNWVSALYKGAFDVGTTVSNLAYNADDLSAQTLTLVAYAEIGDCLKEAVTKAESNFNSKEDLASASKFMALADTYKVCLLKGCDSSYKLVETTKATEKTSKAFETAVFGVLGLTKDAITGLIDLFNDSKDYDHTMKTITDIKKNIGMADFYSTEGTDIVEYLREIKSTTPSEWAKSEIEKAKNYGFLPDYMQNNYQNNITRAEFCTILTWMIEEKTGKGIGQLIEEKGTPIKSPFEDTYYEYADYMCKLGIVNGVSATEFNPLGEITREQAATMLMRTADVLGYDTSYNTSVESGVSSWATEGVGFVTENGIMNGTGNGFEPQGKYTKEQAIATFVRMYDNLK